MNNTKISNNYISISSGKRSSKNNTRIPNNIIFLAKEFPDIDFLVIGGPEKHRKYFQGLSKEKSVFNINFMGFF